jgi:transposase
MQKVRNQWGVTPSPLLPGLAGAELPRIEQRVQMAVLLGQGCPASIVARFCGVDRGTVWRWSARLADGGDGWDGPRSGRPLQLTEDVCIRGMAFYCQVSPLPGCRRWSLRWAEAYLKEHEGILGCGISRSSLQRLLVSQALSPHRHKYFLQITDPDFFPKMESLIDLYLHPPEYLFCLDECPCIQALQRCDPTLEADEGHPDYVGFDYKRLGTTDLFAILRPSNGQVFGRCRPGHAVGTLCDVFREHVVLQPTDAELHYVMDNLTPHYHDDFCALVAELSGVEYARRRGGAARRSWLSSTDKRIVVHFTPFHGSWLNLVEIWFGILKQKCLRDLSVTSVAELIGVIESFIGTWDDLYAHPFTWKYTGEGLPLKAVHRFHHLLRDPVSPMDVKFLTRQLELMPNIARDYRREIPVSDWRELRDLVTLKREELLALIAAEPGPRRKKRALKAWSQFEEFVAKWN